MALMTSVDAQTVKLKTNCLLISITLGTSTATVERSFSCLRHIKTYIYLRSTMLHERLDDLAVISIEKSLSSQDDLVLKHTKIQG